MNFKMIGKIIVCLDVFLLLGDKRGIFNCFPGIALSLAFVINFDLFTLHLLSHLILIYFLFLYFSFSITSLIIPLISLLISSVFSLRST